MSDPNYLSSLRHALQQLDEDIAVNPDPRVSMRESLRKLISTHEESLRPSAQRVVARVTPGNNQQQTPHVVVRAVSGFPVSGAAPQSAVHPTSPANPGRQSKLWRFRRATEEYLRANGPSHRTAILEHLESVGVMGTEKNPLQALGTNFNVWRQVFTSDGKGTFSVLPDVPPDARPLWRPKGTLESSGEATPKETEP
jgi:hypothetical protein